jgi:beta-N-acetylhexosaminidase
VELSPEPSIAAGRLREGPGDWLRRMLPQADLIQLHDWPAERGLDFGGRRLVVVVRDAHRHAWEQTALEALLDQAADAIVVEVGLPVWRPSRARDSVATYGAGRVNVEAAAERLYSGSRRGVEQSGSSPGS